jgi:two-component system, cell cycle sensor histidine kinase and response regulator CckA
MRRSRPRAAARILVVDDEASIVEFADKVLRVAGYETMTATSGDAALKACEQQGLPDLLLTDVKMPRMEGDELAARLRQMDPDLKVLYLTGYADQLFKSKPTLWDGEAFLEKPCTIDGLLEAVSLLLNGQAAAPRLDT